MLPGGSQGRPAEGAVDPRPHDRHARRELFGLRWTDVTSPLARCTWVKQLKTRSSRRQVLLVSVAVDALRRRLAGQREERLLLGLEWDDHGLVFPNTVGKPLHPPTSCSGVSIRCWSGPDSHGSTSTTCATAPPRRWLALASTPKIVSEMLGHSQIAITLDLYSHVTATMQQEAVRAFEGLLGSQEGASEHWNPSSRPCSSMDRATDF
jgi:integrase